MLCCSVVQSCLTLLWPHGLYPLGSSVYGIFQARILLECIAISFSRGSSWPRYRTWVSCTMGKLFTAEPLGTWRALISLLCSKLSYYSSLIFSRLVFLKNYFLSFLFLEIRSYDGWLEFILLDRERGKSKFRAPLARGLRNVGSPASLWCSREGRGWESLLNTSPYYPLHFGFCGCDLKLMNARQHIYITCGFKLLFSFKFKGKSQHHLLRGLILAFSSFC